MTCTDCGAPATCRYDWGAGMRYGCAGHDPLRSLVAAPVRVPGFCQSLPMSPVLATTGHLSIGGGWQHQNAGITPPEAIGTGITPGCNCGPWNSVTPPPACPACGQAPMLQVTC